jgi:mannose-6-phosphate isomerase-like protein (cupin superfamily)
VISDEVEFLLGGETLLVDPEDVVFVPHGVVDRLHDPGIHPATLYPGAPLAGPKGFS